MKLTKEQINKVKLAKSPEELITFAKEISINLSEEKAKEIYNKIHSNYSISDDELMNVTGGCGKGDDPEPKPTPTPPPSKYKIGDRIELCLPKPIRGTIRSVSWKGEGVLRYYEYVMNWDNDVPKKMSIFIDLEGLGDLVRKIN